MPIRIGRTTRRRHITGMAALNIPQPRQGPGDWHKHHCWFASRNDQIETTHYTDDETDGELLDQLGPWGIIDGREGLRRLGSAQK